MATRTLVYIPIIHTQADMGTLGPALNRMKLARLGRRGSARQADLVARKWDAIERAVAKLPEAKLRVYQDGLPVCGREREIVAQMAAAGSRNHQLLLHLEERGAVLMGTESAELLLEEYRLQATAIEARTALAAARVESQQKPLRDALLEKRDRFIAARIDATLAAGETGLLFLGMLHAVNRYLSPDIQVVRPTEGRQAG
jgi:hypothetical protein